MVVASFTIDYLGYMDIKTAISVMSALAQPTRMRVIELLTREHAEGLPVGELARVLETPPNTMSSHLTILSHAGLVAPHREGRVVRYRADTQTVRGLADFLVSHLPATP